MDSKNRVGTSLSEINATVETSQKVGRWSKLFAFFGPAYLVSVGYMDPGNWATDIAAGSGFGYKLIWVMLMSNLTAILLQSFCARLGIVRGLDLAQANRGAYTKWANISLYILAEIAIAATDLAEVLGMAIGLQLLFDLPLLVGVTISVFDTFIILMLLNYGIRKLEALILGLVLLIGLCFLAEIILAQPNFIEVSKGFIPSIPNKHALYLAIGIIGATVMPHNLYLHSSLVQSRKINKDYQSIKKAIKYNVIDSAIALNLAFFVNASILILAATTFYNNSYFEIAGIEEAHKMLAPLLGSNLAPILFAIALIASGQSSTITGTLAGQIVMEGYLDIRIQPWLRRFITRILAVIPAYIVILKTGESGTNGLLILSQVILSLQLGFATIPLIHFVSDKEKMGLFVIPLWQKIIAWLAIALIVFLNLKMVNEQLMQFIEGSTNKFWWMILFGLLAAYFLFLLCYILIIPIMGNKSKIVTTAQDITVHNAPKFSIDLSPKRYSRIAITLDFSSVDNRALNEALALGNHEAQYILIHIVESAGAKVLGKETKDKESQDDRARLSNYYNMLAEGGYNCETHIGYGLPKKLIPQIIKSYNADLLVMGSHGHKQLKDIIFGSTINEVRHEVNIPVLVVR